MHQERNLYAEALTALERIPPSDPDDSRGDAQLKATTATVLADLALCDAIYDLRNHIEELPSRLERRLSKD